MDACTFLFRLHVLRTSTFANCSNFSERLLRRASAAGMELLRSIWFSWAFGLGGRLTLAASDTKGDGRLQDPSGRIIYHDRRWRQTRVL